MANTERKPAAETLRSVAAQKENELLARNEFQEDSNAYDATKIPKEIDGAESERIKLGIMNMYNEDNDYKNPDGENI